MSLTRETEIIITHQEMLDRGYEIVSSGIPMNRIEMEMAIRKGKSYQDVSQFVILSEFVGDGIYSTIYTPKETRD